MNTSATLEAAADLKHPIIAEPLKNINVHQALIDLFEERLIPVDLKLINGKKQAFFPKDWVNRSFDEWDSHNSIAVKTGDGLTVIDIDTKDFALIDSQVAAFARERLQQKDTFIVETTNGYHFYLDTRDMQLSNQVRISDFVDVRSDGGCAFVYSSVEGIEYKILSDHAPMLPTASIESLLVKKVPTGVSYTYAKDGYRVNTTGRIKANAALFSAVNSGNIKRIIKATGMSVEDFVEGQLYVSFNRFAFILANEPSVRNEDVESILKLLVEEVLDFSWHSAETQKYLQQSLRNMIWAPEYFEPEAMRVYLMGNDYYIVDDNHLHEKLNASTAKLHWAKKGYDKNDFVPTVQIITSIKYQVDFFQQSSYLFDEVQKCLHVRINPSEAWQIPDDLDASVIDDFENKIMNGQLKDLIRLIVWSMKKGENKLNKLLLVGCSNKGKTKLMQLMGFVYLTPESFTKAISAKGNGTGLSKEVAEQLQRCGLLLADDIVDIPLGIKNVSDVISAPVYYKGAVELPLKFLVMTSTHQSHIDMLNDELKNRILVMKIEGDYTFDKSLVWQKDRKHYEEQSKLYIQKLILEAIVGNPSDEEFLELQNRFRAPNNNQRDEIIELVRDRIQKQLHEMCSDDLNYEQFTMHQGCYFVKTKAAAKKVIADIVKDEFSDHKIDLKKEVSLLADELIGERDQSIAIGSSTRKYYQLNMEAKEIAHNPLDDL